MFSTLGGVASGSVELRSDGSLREWTLYNQNPAGGAKFSKQACHALF